MNNTTNLVVCVLTIVLFLYGLYLYNFKKEEKYSPYNSVPLVDNNCSINTGYAYNNQYNNQDYFMSAPYIYPQNPSGY